LKQQALDDERRAKRVAEKLDGVEGADDEEVDEEFKDAEGKKSFDSFAVVCLTWLQNSMTPTTMMTWEMITMLRDTSMMVKPIWRMMAMMGMMITDCIRASRLPMFDLARR
jgi:hypothetical protein